MAVGAILLSQRFPLQGGHEWAWPFWVPRAGVLNVTTEGDLAHYAGVYTRDQYDRARASAPVRFPFLIGSARLTHFLRYTIQGPGEYVIVVRVTSWAGLRTASIQAVVQIAP